MARTIEAKTVGVELADLLDEISHGGEITITRDGAPVARLVPIERARHDVAAVIEEIHQFRRRANITLGDLTLEEMIEAGRM